MATYQRNAYIDVMKFLLALIIAEFHLNSGIFPGGRVAVEGFFMISGYLMMVYIHKNKYPKDSLGISTIRFLIGKYISLFPILLASIILSCIIFVFRTNLPLLDFLKRSPTLLFDIIPLNEAGFRGLYLAGISWYLSAMFLSLGILYPLCKKYHSNFTLTVCPLLCILIYGALSHFYSHLAIASTYLDGMFISSGLLRGLAGCSAGCVVYEVSVHLPRQPLTATGRILFTAAELIGFAYLFYAMHTHPKSEYEYVLIFVLFGLLIIGINQLSATAFLLNPRWSKPLGICSTLIVLNHCYWRDFLPAKLGTNYMHTENAWIYFAATASSCFVAYWLSKLITLCIKKFSKIKLWVDA